MRSDIIDGCLWTIAVAFIVGSLYMWGSRFGNFMWDLGRQPESNIPNNHIIIRKGKLMKITEGIGFVEYTTSNGQRFIAQKAGESWYVFHANGSSPKTVDSLLTKERAIELARARAEAEEEAVK